MLIWWLGAYWTNYDGGRVVTVPLAGGLPTVLATQQLNPTGIAVDASSVYWVNGVLSGALMKVTKP